MANEGQKANVDPTLKVNDARLREVFAWLCGERFDLGHDTGCDVALDEPTPSELASIANDLISTRTALTITNETCTQLEEQLEAAELTQRSCA